MRLKDKVALVTGASSGIGAGIAARFAAEGARVAVNFRPGSPKDRDAAEAAVAGFGANAIAVEADVSKHDQVEAMVARVVEAFGRIDIAVNNAGIEINKPFLETTDEEWNRVLGVNLQGGFYVSQAAARAMVKQGGGGRLIFISSVHEDIPFPNYTSYCASKGAIRMMMRNLCIELAPHGITANNIAPGAIATPINQTVLDNPIAFKNAVSEIPLGRFGKPEEVASVAVFLASDEASYVTGSTYYVDGGLTQQVTMY
ncbi:glucose 1-dehydrogenase [Longimicrobium sp.]|uniref:SDR family NAD(P)-dependent oxidoreductase n=1 Tax=Longimicrobium sp. TaxID=2029185 RepID=UPI002BA31948|nr:glucose 1-dehydrogenase [Longimicrobium sp.]HSU12954.1 glucose 1-dehydrogenase [Longimicrobium sp.]